MRRVEKEPVAFDRPLIRDMNKLVYRLAFQVFEAFPFGMACVVRNCPVIMEENME